MEDPEAELPQTPPSDAAGRVEWWIKTLIANASALRDAGVSSLAVDGLSATLLPKEPPPPKLDDIKNDEQLPDGLPAHLDPRSYPGGYLPGFTIEKLPTEE